MDTTVIPELPTITLPNDPVEVTERLIKGYNFDYYIEKLYPQIAAHAGSTYNPGQFVLMIVREIAEYETTQDPELPSLTLLSMEKWIDALANDVDFAKIAKEIYLQTKKEVRAKMDAKIPPRVEPKGPIKNDQLFKTAMKIRDAFFDEVRRGDPEHLIDIRMAKNGINPCYHQTEKGLFLEYYYDQPSKIWTPWGYLDMVGFNGYRGDAPWEPIIEKFLERLGATLYLPKTIEKWGQRGPVYAIHRLDDLILPEPKIREKQNFWSYEKVMKALEVMNKRYLGL